MNSPTNHHHKAVRRLKEIYRSWPEYRSSTRMLLCELLADSKKTLVYSGNDETSETDRNQVFTS